MSDGSGAAVGAGMALLLLFLFYAAVVAFCVYLYVRIARKAGYSGWYAALLFVPLVNIGVVIAFAFVEWPVERELRAARASRGYDTAVTQQPHPVGYTSVPMAAAGPGPAPYGQPTMGYPSRPPGSPHPGQFPAPGIQPPAPGGGKVHPPA